MANQLVTFVLMCGAVLFARSDALQTSRIDHLVIIVRHGERYPLFPIPEMGDFPIGGLTPNGMKQEHDFGERMRSTFPTHISACKDNRLKAADKDRCIDTATQILSGMGISNYSSDVFKSIEINVQGEHIPEFLVKMKNFQASLPSCVREVLEILAEPMIESAPPKMEPILKTFLATQVADSLDVLREVGYKGLAFGLNISECIPAKQKVFDDTTFSMLSEFCMETLCKSDTKVLLDEITEFAKEGFDSSTPNDVKRSLSVYGLNDVHILGLSKAILLGEEQLRPAFGSFIILAVCGDDVHISTGASVYSEPEHRATMNIYELMNKLQRTL